MTGQSAPHIIRRYDLTKADTGYDLTEVSPREFAAPPSITDTKRSYGYKTGRLMMNLYPILSAKDESLILGGYLGSKGPSEHSQDTGSLSDPSELNVWRAMNNLSAIIDATKLAAIDDNVILQPGNESLLTRLLNSIASKMEAELGQDDQRVIFYPSEQEAKAKSQGGTKLSLLYNITEPFVGVLTSVAADTYEVISKVSESANKAAQRLWMDSDGWMKGNVGEVLSSDGENDYFASLAHVFLAIPGFSSVDKFNVWLAETSGEKPLHHAAIVSAMKTILPKFKNLDLSFKPGTFRLYQVDATDMESIKEGFHNMEKVLGDSTHTVLTTQEEDVIDF